MYPASAATSAPNSTRPAREFGVVRGIGNHEEGEEEDGAALGPVERNRDRLAKVKGPSEHEREV